MTAFVPIQGEVAVVVGHNGSGKSLFLRELAGATFPAGPLTDDGLTAGLAASVPSDVEWADAEFRRAFPGRPDFPLAQTTAWPLSGGERRGLSFLFALAAAKAGAVLAFDDFGEGLHPHAVRALLHAARGRADAVGFAVVLTTHNPIVLNQFRDRPELVFVLGHGEAGFPDPAPLSDLHDECWLAQSHLGTGYEELKFGAPPIPKGEG